MAKTNQQTKKASQPTEAEVMMKANKVNEIWQVGGMWYVDKEKASSASDRTGLPVEHFTK